MKFWVFAQKSLGGHEDAARRLINFYLCSWFVYELPGGNELPPGGTTLSVSFSCCLVHGSFDFWNSVVFY